MCIRDSTLGKSSCRNRDKMNAVIVPLQRATLQRGAGKTGAVRRRPFRLWVIERFLKNNREPEDGAEPAEPHVMAAS